LTPAAFSFSALMLPQSISQSIKINQSINQLINGLLRIAAEGWIHSDTMK